MTIKTCDRCKALEESYPEFTCLLGFAINQLDVVGSTIKSIKVGPTCADGLCPKPTTYADFVWWSRQVPP